MNDILRSYLALLEEVDIWFSLCQKQAGSERIHCGPGCSGCCRGLFDITLMEACLLQEGFRLLPSQVQSLVLERAWPRLNELSLLWPGFGPPYLLNHLPESEWTEMPEEDQTPCPLLGTDGCCLVYKYRPMTCRLHGIPNIDLSGESFSDACCTLNFIGEDPLARQDLRWKFRDVFVREIDLFRKFSATLTGAPVWEMDTFIPAALFIDFNVTNWRL